MVTPPKKEEEGTASFRLCVYAVCVCDCLYLKKKNEAERHLGSGLDGKSPYQVSAQQLKMQLNSSLILLLLVVVVVGFGPFFVFFYTPKPIRSLTSSPLTFPPFFNIFLRVWYPPSLCTSLHPVLFLQEKKTTSFFSWITITKSSRYTIFSENRVFSAFYLDVYWKFPFLFRHFTQVIYDTGNRINI